MELVSIELQTFSASGAAEERRQRECSVGSGRSATRESRDGERKVVGKQWNTKSCSLPLERQRLAARSRTLLTEVRQRASRRRLTWQAAIRALTVNLGGMGNMKFGKMVKSISVVSV